MFEVHQIVCKVNNIKTAVEDFEKLGFRVEWGGKPGKSYNAYVKFENGPMIELFTMPVVAYYLSAILGIYYGKNAREKWQKWCKCEEGICDFNLMPVDSKLSSYNGFEKIPGILKSKSILCSPLIVGGKKEESGKKLKYKYMMLNYTGFPFILSNYNDKRSRNQPLKHKNGACEVSEIVLRVKTEDQKEMNFLTQCDKRVHILQGEKNELVGIRLKNLKGPLNDCLLHGINIINE